MVGSAAVVTVAAAAVLMVRGVEVELGVRSKGQAHIGYVIKRDGRVMDGANEAIVYPDDQVRFRYTTERDSYLVLVNVDTTGPTVYFPTTQSHAMPIPRGAARLLEFGVELDATLGRERVIAVFCDAPIEVSTAVAVVRGPTPSAPDGCRLDVLTLHKRERP